MKIIWSISYVWLSHIVYTAVLTIKTISKHVNDIHDHNSFLEKQPTQSIPSDKSNYKMGISL